MNKKEAIRAYKETKQPAGAFAVRCAVSGRVWVGSSSNLHAIKNRMWATLRQGGQPDKSMQQDWNAHGEPAFEYEILEALKDDVLPMTLPALLKEKKVEWVQKLGAEATVW